MSVNAICVAFRYPPCHTSCAASYCPSTSYAVSCSGPASGLPTLEPPKPPTTATSRRNRVSGYLLRSLR